MTAVWFGRFVRKMNRGLCLFVITSCLLLSSDRRAVQAHPAEGETVTGSNMSNYSTIPPKTESMTPSVKSVHISTESKHLISASTGVPPKTGPGFHVGSFIGGIMLAFIVILVITLGYRKFFSKREIRYRVIEEHDAII